MDLVSASTDDNKIAWYRNAARDPGWTRGMPIFPPGSTFVISTTSTSAYKLEIADFDGVNGSEPLGCAWLCIRGC